MFRYSAGIESLWFGVNLCQLLWAVRIWRLDLGRVRPFLLAYLSIGLPMICSSFAIRWFGPEEAWAYELFWRWTQPLYWAITLLVLVETYNHVFGRLGGFRTAGRLFYRLTSVGVGALYLWMILVGDMPESWYEFWGAHQWGFFVAAATFFFLIAVFARIFHAPLSANDQLVIVTFGLMIAGSAAAMTLQEIWSARVHEVAIVVMPAIYLCMFGLAALRFSKQGENANAEETEASVAEAEILENLDTMNRALGKTLRK